MKVAVTGSHGLIGSALLPALADAGHQPVRIVRAGAAPAQGAPGKDAPPAFPDVTWDLAAGRLDPADLAGVDAVVHLAGAGLGERRWTAAYKREVLESRTRSTDLLARTLAQLDEPRPALISGSAVGFYGDRGDETLTETSTAGSGFLAEVARQWEAATAPAEAAGVRTVHLRTGIVVSGRGGALGRTVPLFRFGLGGRLGSGRQWWSWIALDDEVGAILHLLTADVHGPVNATAPNPVTNREFTRALGRALHRPTVLAVPAPALRVALGREMADEMILAGQRALPAVLEGAGYQFRFPTLDLALAGVLAGAGRA